MDVLLWSAAVLLVLLGLAGIVVPALPGTILIFAGLVMAAWADGFEKVGGITIAVLGLLTALSFAVDFAATGAGARRTGSGKQAMVGAIIGTVAGVPFGLVGILVGPFAGAVIGEFLAHRDLLRAGKAGYGAVIGLVFGAALKLALAFGMIGLFLAAYLIDG